MSVSPTKRKPFLTVFSILSPFFFTQGPSRFQSAVSLLPVVGNAHGVRLLQEPRGHNSHRRPPLHHGEGHLCALGQDVQRHVQLPRMVHGRFESEPAHRHTVRDKDRNQGRAHPVVRAICAMGFWYHDVRKRNSV